MSSAAKSPDDERPEAEMVWPTVPPLSPELAKLLDERTAKADANPGAGYTWEEFVAYVKRKKQG